MSPRRWLAWLLARRRRSRPVPGPVPPEGLARAVAECGYRCLECQSPVVRLDYAPALGWVPVIVHWPLSGGGWCPALAGDPVAGLESLDLLAALAAVLAPVGDYEEPVWHRRQLAAA